MSQLKRILSGDYYSAARDISRIFLFGCGGAAEKKTIGHRQKDATMGTLCCCFFVQREI
jgi:hypothetical protein